MNRTWSQWDSSFATVSLLLVSPKCSHQDQILLYQLSGLGLGCSRVRSKWLLLPLLPFLSLTVARDYIASFLGSMRDDHFCEGCIGDLSRNNYRTVRSLSCLRRRNLLYQLILVFLVCLRLELILLRKRHLGQTLVHVSYHETVVGSSEEILAFCLFELKETYWTCVVMGSCILSS